MKIVLALMVMYCQNHLDYKGCVDEKMACVDEYVTIKLENTQRQSHKILIGKIEESYAQGYLHCVDTIGDDGCLDK